MKTFKHLTLIYVKNRIAEIVYRLMFPNEPWLTRDANSIISSYIKKTQVALEFGSGRSTVWLAKRVAELVSVEHDKKWFNLVSQKLQKERITNVTYFLCEHDKNLKNNKGYESEYVRVANKYQDENFDLILIDGPYRSSCALIAVKKLRKGGILIIDNINWYLPSNNKTSPDSIPINSGTVNEKWDYFVELVKNWKLEWTTNGVTDTAIWYKPI